MAEKSNVKTRRKLTPQNATFMDHHYMTHWLWSCERNGRTYLSLSEQYWRDITANTQEDSDILDQAKYHFIATLGYMLRVLDVSVRLFPELAPAYDEAIHIRTEGKKLRDMIEHAYGGHQSYMEGDGRSQEDYERNAGHCVADATSDTIGDYGHLLGNRLCVEQALEEIGRIRSVAANIAVPMDADPGIT